MNVAAAGGTVMTSCSPFSRRAALPTAMSGNRMKNGRSYSRSGIGLERRSESLQTLKKNTSEDEEKKPDERGGDRRSKKDEEGDQSEEEGGEAEEEVG